MATFITSKLSGTSIGIEVESSQGYWKYNHNGIDSSPLPNGLQYATISGSSGEFTIISCDSIGNVGGVITIIRCSAGQIISFNGIGLSGLIELDLLFNDLTGFTGTGLSSLTTLKLNENNLQSFDGDGLSSITYLSLYSNELSTINISNLTTLEYFDFYDNNLTEFTGIGLSNVVECYLNNNQIVSFNGGDLTNLTTFSLANNPLVSFNGGNMVSLMGPLDFYSWNITTLESFNGGNMTSLIGINLNSNQITSLNNLTLPSSLIALNLEKNKLTSFNGVELPNLTGLDLYDNLLTGFTGTGLINLIYLNLNDNPLVSFNGGNMVGITELSLSIDNGITTLESFNGGNMTGLTTLNLYGNPLTSFDGGNMVSLTGTLDFPNIWNITTLESFNGGNMTGITSLNLSNNQLTLFNDTKEFNLKELSSFTGTGLTSLNYLNLSGNQLTYLDLTGLNFLQYLYVNGNPLPPEVNDSLIILLAYNQSINLWIDGVTFITSGERTIASEEAYNYLIMSGSDIEGVELIRYYYEAINCITSEVLGTIEIYYVASKGIKYSMTDGVNKYCVTIGLETSEPSNFSGMTEYSNCFECLNSEEINILSYPCDDSEIVTLPITAFTNSSQIINNGESAVSYICYYSGETIFCACFTFDQTSNEPTVNVSDILNTHSTCGFCLLVNTPRSANTETIVCVETCESGTFTQIVPPHPVWTDGYGTPVTQLNAITLGGPNGLNA